MHFDSLVIPCHNWFTDIVSRATIGRLGRWRCSPGRYLRSIRNRYELSIQCYHILWSLSSTLTHLGYLLYSSPPSIISSYLLPYLSHHLAHLFLSYIPATLHFFLNLTFLSLTSLHFIDLHALYEGVLQDVLTVTSPIWGEYVWDIKAVCVAPLPQGPYVLYKGTLHNNLVP